MTSTRALAGGPTKTLFSETCYGDKWCHGAPQNQTTNKDEEEKRKGKRDGQLAVERDQDFNLAFGDTKRVMGALALLAPF